MIPARSLLLIQLISAFLRQVRFDSLLLAWEQFLKQKSVTESLGLRIQEIERVDSGVSLSILNDYIDPVKHPNKWLKATLSAMVGNLNSKKSREAVVAMADWIEPGVVDDMFIHWIEASQQAVDQQENNRSSVDPPCSLED